MLLDIKKRPDLILVIVNTFFFLFKFPGKILRQSIQPENLGTYCEKKDRISPFLDVWERLCPKFA